MSETKHLKSPWLIEKHNVKDFEFFKIVNKQRLIADFVPFKPTAQLIAAAPDMLEALESIINIYSSFASGLIGSEAEYELRIIHEMRIKAVNALSKVKGE